jgi:acyl-CoA synthetase (AMP-forming)/AMP-acid ligase II
VCAQHYPDRIFLIYDDIEISFGELNRQANRYAHIALESGLKPGEVGAVMIENRPEFFYAWLGLAKIGAIASLLNTQARGKALGHAIEETNSKILFLGGECVEKFATAEGLPDKLSCFYVTDAGRDTVIPAGVEPLAVLLAAAPDTNPASSLRADVVGETPVFYVFTSGTTGLPKAAIISHMRWLGVGDGWAAVLGMTDEDVFYCILPLFHGAAGMSLVSNARLVKYDIENDCHLRADDGYLIECEPGDIGELLGMVLNIPGVGAGRFEGYVSAEATENKIMRNVFSEGDAWFRSGDLLVQDAEGYFYFSDRIGDTYRWKSENVSTTEVTEALEGYQPAEMMNVYGVAVPGQEGRAGMVALELKRGEIFDPLTFYQQATENLPAYAVPLFVRVRPQSDLTVTFKLRKVDLQKAGYDPNNINDPLYVLDNDAGTYVPYCEAALKKLGVEPFRQ